MWPRLPRSQAAGETREPGGLMAWQGLPAFSKWEHYLLGHQLLGKAAGVNQGIRHQQLWQASHSSMGTLIKLSTGLPLPLP